MIAIGDKLYRESTGAEYTVVDVRGAYLNVTIDHLLYVVDAFKPHVANGDRLLTRAEYDRLLLARGMRLALERFAREASDAAIIAACEKAGIGAEKQKERVGE